MKQITIAIHDNSSDNYNLELIKFIKDNVESYPQLMDEIEFIYYDELNKLDLGLLPKFIELYTDLKTYNLALQRENSRYVMFIDAQDVLIEPLEQLLITIKKQSADVIVTPLMLQNYSGEVELIKTKGQVRLFSQEKFDNYYADVAQQQVKASLFKKAFLNNHNLLSYSNDRLTSFFYYAKVILNVPVTTILVKSFYAIRQSNLTGEQVGGAINQLLTDYKQTLKYQQIDLNHPYNKYIRSAYINKMDQQMEIAKTAEGFEYEEYLNHFKNLDHKHQNEIKKYEYKRLQQQYHNLMLKSMTINKMFIKLPTNNRKKEKINNVVYKLFSVLPVQKDKILIVNNDNNYQGEMRYLVNKMLMEDEKKIYCTSLTKVKGVKTYNQKNKFVNLYHLATSKQIINLDISVNGYKLKSGQELIQMFNDKNHQKILIDQNNFTKYYPKHAQSQIRENLKNVATIWVENKENRRYIRQSLGNKKVVVKDFPSTLWIKKYQNNGKMLMLLRKKYRFEMLKEYVLYIADETPYYQFINVEKINKSLSKNQVLVIVPPKNKYEITNINQQAYILLDNQVNVVELCLAADAIINNNHYYVANFKALNKQIIDINYTDEVRKEIIGEF